MADDYSDFGLVTGNAGRGNINPPLVGQPQPGAVNPNLTTIGSNRLTQLGNQAQALAEGGANGVTAGLFNYVPAGLAYLADRLRNHGNTKPLSFNETLAATRAHTADVKENAPLTYGAGDIAGSVALALETGGNSIPLQMANQGVQGAVRKYTESPDTTAKDAAVAGGISTLAAGALGALGAGFNKLGALAKEKIIKQYAEEFGIPGMSVPVKTAEGADAVLTTKGTPLPYDEAAKDVAANAGQQGTLDVAKGAASAVARTAAAGALPVAGAVTGSYVGGKTADLLGTDHATGQRIGEIVGGGGASYGAYKAQLLKKGLQGAIDTVGFGSSVNPQFGTQMANKVIKTAIPAAQAVITQPTKPSTYDDYSDFGTVK